MAHEPTGDALTVEKTETKTQPPRMYKVLLHNDDYTPMDFVVMVLETVFNKDHASATEVMMNVHKRGVGVAGVYPFQIAETKATRVIHLAESEEHPLMCSLDPE